MTIQLKYTNLEGTEAIETYATEKFGMIKKMLGGLDAEGIADLHLDLAYTSRHHQKGDIYAVKANLHIPGRTFQIEETAEDLYSAIDIAKDKLHHVIEKYKDLKLEERS